MNEIDKKIYDLQSEIRASINNSGIALPVVEAVLDGIKGEVLKARMDTIMSNLLKEEEKDNTEEKEV